MRISHFFLSAFSLLCISAVNLLSQENFIEVLSPKENKLQTELSVGVVFEIKKPDFDSIKIVTSLEQIVVDLNSSKKMKCKNIALRLGENTISIRAYKNEEIVDEKIRHIYVSSQLHHEFKYPPEIYKQEFFHNNDQEAKCVKCHNMSVNEKDGVAFIDVTKSNCYLCHKNITKDKYGHAPAVNWLCTSCHNVSNNGQSKYIAPEPVNSSCFKCHKENQKLWRSSKYAHEPLDAGHCTKCHNPHASPYNMFVRKPVNEICMGCHKDKHIKAIESKKSACSGTLDGNLCIKCHTPHASNRPFFLKELSDKVTK